MNKSESIENLATALCKVQSAIRGFKEDSENPFFKSKYGDLTSVWAAARKPLTDNGLCVTQTMSEGMEGCVVVETTLMHSSGEWISGKLEMKPDKPGPQAVGSCLTYARRYSLAAIVGIAPAEDDAESATNHDNKQSDKDWADQKSAQITRADKQKAAAKKADKEAKPVLGEPVNEDGFRGNPEFTQFDSDTVEIPAKFKSAPKSGKSLIYTIAGEDIIFPIGHVESHSDDAVRVTEWIAGKKTEDGKLDESLCKPVIYNQEDYENQDIPR